MSRESLPNHPQQEEAEEDHLLLREAAVVHESTDRFFHPHLANRPPCNSCGCHRFSASSFSSGSHKRFSSENPCSSHEPNPKKPSYNDNYTNSLSGFCKIPLSPPPQENEPFLRRCVSDPSSPPLAPVVEEPPLSPPPNPEIERPGTPSSNTIASAKLPPRPPTLRRSVSDPTPSPAKTFSSSSESREAERLRKMGQCVREISQKWDEHLGSEADSANASMSRQNENPRNHNNNNDSAMENSEEGLNESVSVERKGDLLIIHFKCPCGSGYHILLLGGNCYHKLIM